MGIDTVARISRTNLTRLAAERRRQPAAGHSPRLPRPPRHDPVVARARDATIAPEPSFDMARPPPHLTVVPPDHRVGAGDVHAVVRTVSPSLGVPAPRRVSRQFAAVAFVDIADSTIQLRHHGDRKWSTVLADFRAECARTIGEHGGRMVKTMGDGLLATFSTASNAIDGLRVIRLAARGRNLAVRAAVHAAEIELVGADIAGVGVHAAARVEALTAAGELWVTRTVHDVIAGSGILLDDRGDHVLKGFDEPWRLFAVRE